jgi:hypothetical protein
MEGPRLIGIVEAGTWSESLYSRFLNRSCRHFEADPCRVDLIVFFALFVVQCVGVFQLIQVRIHPC